MTSGISGSGGTGGIPPYQSPGSNRPGRKDSERGVSDSESTSSSSSSKSSGLREAVGGAARKALGAAKKFGGDFAKGIKDLGGRIKTGIGRSKSEGDLSTTEDSPLEGTSRSYSEGDISVGGKTRRERIEEKLKKLKEKVSATGKTIRLGFSGSKEKGEPVSKTTWYVDLETGDASPKGASKGSSPLQLPKKVLNDLKDLFTSTKTKSSSSSSASSSVEDLSSGLMEQAEILMGLGGGDGLEVLDNGASEKTVYAQLAVDGGKKAAKTSKSTEEEWTKGKNKLAKALKGAQKVANDFEKKLGKATKDMAKAIFGRKGSSSSETGDLEDFVVRYNAKTETVTIEKGSPEEEVQYAEIIFQNQSDASKIVGGPRPAAAKVVTSKPHQGSLTEVQVKNTASGFAAKVSLQTVVDLQRKVLTATANTLEAVENRGAPGTERQARREIAAQSQLVNELQDQMNRMRNRVQGRDWAKFEKDITKS